MTPSKMESTRQTQIKQLEESVRNYQQQADHLESELGKVNEELTMSRKQAKQVCIQNNMFIYFAFILLLAISESS